VEAVESDGHAKKNRRTVMTELRILLVILGPGGVPLALLLFREEIVGWVERRCRRDKDDLFRILASARSGLSSDRAAGVAIAVARPCRTRPVSSIAGVVASPPTSDPAPGAPCLREASGAVRTARPRDRTDRPRDRTAT
jgi:hypothetical protein